MEDRLKKLKEISGFMESQGYETVLVDAPNPFLFIDIVVSGYEFRLKCIFPKAFPYVFPKIYVLNAFLKELPFLPHVQYANEELSSVCTFDSNISFPNAQKPNEVVLECIKRTEEIIKDGINKENIEDFSDEFGSYWTSFNAFNIKCYSLIVNTNKPQELLYFLEDNKSRNRLNFYVCDKYYLDNFIKWLSLKLNMEVSEGEFKKALYLPLDVTGYPPYPINNLEMFKMMMKQREFNRYNSFLRKTHGLILVLFSLKIGDSSNLFGWLHYPLIKSFKGFRKGKVDPKVSMLWKQSKEEILRFRIDVLNKDRLFYRGGNGLEVPSIKVSVTGCGSVGSFLIQSLVQLGIGEFSLIDKEYLTSENIARHICGAEDLELEKTEAVKNKLIKHYPYLKLNCHCFDLWNDLDRAIKIYEEQDYNFIVVGNMPIENKLVEMFNNKAITKPLVILWVEPFLLGGHAIILQSPMRDTSSIYNHEFSFVNKVLENGHKYIRKESGCESTFIPYSALEIQMFILSFLDYFNENFIQSKNEGNYLFSWGGKLRWARENSYAVTSKWLGKKDRSAIIKRLDE
ncbi:ThiF family adenylyltransferase [Tissierella carlieri]|uniref:ThiF family adenylyltransferase n=1 Tax=Tissierella carlieri TaxID=689904 RepID=A0ABT1SEN8_9FIRM|nr:ThiF family adenylyltransferase [Tissierella carlieri]MCQ4924953.1 ThiF family adenylyltransferase [Tissierella carlieri]